MKEDIKFSILVPAFKARFLAECIDSILSQTYTNLELIIVNDASPENLDEIVSRYDDARIQYYVNEKNFGAINVVDNWNKCLSYATGEYVICMGDDDKLMPCCLEEYRKLIEKYPEVDVLHGRTIIMNEDSQYTSITNDRAEWESVYSLARHRFEGYLQFIGDFCYKRSPLVSCGGFYHLPLAWGSDDISAYRAALEYGIANVNNPVFLYRQSDLTISSNPNTKTKVDGAIKMYNWIRDNLLSLHPVELTDKLTLAELERQLFKAQEKSFCYIFRQELSHHKLRVFYWILNRKKYDITFNCLIRSLF